MKAIITLEYNDPKTAKSVAEAVAPENLKTPPGLKVRTNLRDALVVTGIDLDGTVATFIATIDDLLESTSIAEKAICVVQ